MGKIIYNILLLFAVQVSIAQVGIGIENPETDLDVNAYMKASGLPDVSAKMDQYNRILYADAEGNIGYRQRSENAFIYRNSYFAVMKEYKLIRTVLTELDLVVIVPVLPHSKSMIELSYSLGVMNGQVGNASVLIGRSVDQGPEEMLHNATRSFSFNGYYSSFASAHGRAISNIYYDEIENNTAYVKFVTYKAYGITTNRTYQAKFGMYAAVGSTIRNFNWGRGSLNVNVFDYE